MVVYICIAADGLGTVIPMINYVREILKFSEV